MLAPVAMVAGCSQSPSPAEVDLQQRVVAAEARADAAEKRLKSLAACTSAPALSAQPDVATGPDTYGQPMDNTAPISAAPANVNPANANPASAGPPAVVDHTQLAN